MTRPGRSNRTYADRYCSYHSIPVDQFVDHLLGRTLHAPLRWVWFAVKPFAGRRFEVDYACLAAIGQFTRRREMHDELVEFSYHPRNRTFWRSVAGQRISTQRVRDLLRDLPE